MPDSVISAPTPSSSGNPGKRPERAADVDMDSEDEEEEEKKSAPPRFALPHPFSGERKELRSFFLQIQVYCQITSLFKTNAEKALLIATLLKGEAFDWFEPYVQEYLQWKDDEEKTPSDKTKQLFGSFTELKTEFTKLFGIPDEDKVAERKLRTLKQIKSAANYAAEFERWVGRAHWEGAAVCSAYYDGLKDKVKDEIMRLGKPKDFDLLRDISIQIDENQYERSLERRGNPSIGYYPQRQPDQQPRRQGNSQPKERYYGEPMECDNTESKGKARGKGRHWDVKERLCYSCGKPGHMARECKNKQFNAMYQGTMQVNAITRDEIWRDANFHRRPEMVGPKPWDPKLCHQALPRIPELGVLSNYQPPPDKTANQPSPPEKEEPREHFRVWEDPQENKENVDPEATAGAEILMEICATSEGTDSYDEDTTEYDIIQDFDEVEEVERQEELMLELSHDDDPYTGPGNQIESEAMRKANKDLDDFLELALDRGEEIFEMAQNNVNVLNSIHRLISTSADPLIWEELAARLELQATQQRYINQDLDWQPTGSEIYAQLREEQRARSRFDEIATRRNGQRTNLREVEERIIDIQVQRMSADPNQPLYRELRAPPFQIPGLANLRHQDHHRINWSYCTFDACTAHAASKKGFRHFPSVGSPNYWIERLYQSTPPQEEPKEDQQQGRFDMLQALADMNDLMVNWHQPPKN
jgi:hypothetical protein